MDIISVVIFVLFLFVGYKIYQKYNTAEQFKPTKFFDNSLESEINEQLDADYQTHQKFGKKTPNFDRMINKQKKIQINEIFEESQYNQNYKDTIYAFELLSPNQKQIFNTSDQPITHTSKLSKPEVFKLVKSFIEEVNATVKNHVDLTDGPSGVKHESGWDRQQKALGLPTSIYDKPAPKAPIRLVKIDKAEKYETDDEIRFVVFLIIQKIGVEEQMVVKVSLVVGKTDLNLDRDFFRKKKNVYETSVKLEEVSIIGFLTNNRHGKYGKNERDKFYDYDEFEDGHMFKPEDIVKALNKKKRQNDKENAMAYKLKNGR